MCGCVYQVPATESLQQELNLQRDWRTNLDPKHHACSLKNLQKKKFLHTHTHLAGLPIRCAPTGAGERLAEKPLCSPEYCGRATRWNPRRKTPEYKPPSFSGVSRKYIQKTQNPKTKTLLQRWALRIHTDSSGYPHSMEDLLMAEATLNSAQICRMHSIQAVLHSMFEGIIAETLDDDVLNHPQSNLSPHN